jgi:O-antigen/teichoic acid export membrane protein
VDASPPGSGAPSLKERLLSGGAWAVIGRAGGVFFAFATNALLARLLSPADMGAYFLATSLIAVFWLLAALGLNTAVVRFVAENLGLGKLGRVRSAVRLVLYLGTAGAVVVGLLLALLGGPLVEFLFDAPALAAATGLLAVWLALGTVQGLIAEIFRGFSDIRLAVIFLNFNGILSAGLLVSALAFIWVFVGTTNLPTVISIAAVASLLCVVPAGFLLRRKLGKLPEENGGETMKLGEVWSVGWPLLMTNLIVFALAYADLWIVGAFLPQEDVALYGAALRTVLLVAAPMVIAEAVVPPLIAELNSQGRRRELERTLRAVATLAGIPGFVVLVVFIVFGAPIMGLVFGEFYRDAALVLAILSVGHLVTISFGLCVPALYMTGNQFASMVITLAGSSVAILGGFAVVGSFGIVGVAFAAAAGLIIHGFLSFLTARRRIGVWTHVGFSGLSDAVVEAKGLIQRSRNR